MFNMEIAAASSVQTFMGAADLYKFGFIGHGRAGTIQPTKNVEMLAGSRYTHHHIAEMQLIACETYLSEWNWHKNVSDTGWLTTIDGILAVTMPTGWSFRYSHGEP